MRHDDDAVDAKGGGVCVPYRGQDVLVDVFAFLTEIAGAFGNDGGERGAVLVAWTVDGEKRDLEGLADREDGVLGVGEEILSAVGTAVDGHDERGEWRSGGFRTGREGGETCYLIAIRKLQGQRLWIHIDQKDTRNQLLHSRIPNISGVIEQSAIESQDNLSSTSVVPVLNQTQVHGGEINIIGEMSASL